MEKILMVLGKDIKSSVKITLDLMVGIAKIFFDLYENLSSQFEKYLIKKIGKKYSGLVKLGLSLLPLIILSLFLGFELAIIIVICYIFYSGYIINKKK